MELSLNDPWYDLVKCGKKIYEGRRFTEKVASIKIGDMIKLRHHTNPACPKYNVIVEDILKFQTFEDALANLPIEKVLPLDGITIEKGIEIYSKYVSLPTQMKDGVVMIKIAVLQNIT